jgi:fermentation-respiration switch protein FrsA (DUF1100 family)
LVREKLAETWPTWPFQWPLSFLVSDTWNAGDAIESLNYPFLIIHGEADTVVPYSDGKALFDRAHGEKVFWPVAGAHTAAFGSASSPYRDRLVSYLKRHASSPR